MVNGIRDIVFVRDPEPWEEISKGSNTGSITNRKIGNGWHEDRSPWIWKPILYKVWPEVRLTQEQSISEGSLSFRPKNRIMELHDEFYTSKRARFQNSSAMSWAWVERVNKHFTKMSQNRLMISVMTAQIYMCHKKRTALPIFKVCSGYAKWITLLFKRHEAPH